MWGARLAAVATLFAVVLVLGSRAAQDGEETCFCDLKGAVDDCCCSVEDVDKMNMELHPLLERLAKSQFFRFYRVNMDRPCKFWKHEEAGCKTEHCSVESCDESEVPESMRAMDLTGEKFSCGRPEPQKYHVKDTLTASEHETLATWQAIEESHMEFCDIEDEDLSSMDYVNLVDNPERFTGYAGSSPAQIWRAIYSEHCFKPDDENFRFFTSDVVREMCIEKRVFYRVVSGLHAAINIHVAAHYPTPTSFLGQLEWGPNVTLFNRFFHPDKTFSEGPNWIRNIYFNLLLLLRSLERAESYWSPEKFKTGNVEEDEEVPALVQEILQVASRHCPNSFDETLMFSEPERQALRDEFRVHFRNVSRIMDCVECSTCRLWGKLKVHGLGTSMKLLFNEQPGQLKRNEVVALFNTVAQFSQAIAEVHMFRDLTRMEVHGNEADSHGKPRSATADHSEL